MTIGLGMAIALGGCVALTLAFGGSCEVCVSVSHCCWLSDFVEPALRFFNYAPSTSSAIIPSLQLATMVAMKAMKAKKAMKAMRPRQPRPTAGEDSVCWGECRARRLRCGVCQGARRFAMKAKTVAPIEKVTAAAVAPIEKVKAVNALKA
jgi:hypothetical protein